MKLTGSISFVFYWLGKDEMLKSVESIMCKSALILAVSILYFARKNSILTLEIK